MPMLLAKLPRRHRLRHQLLCDRMGLRWRRGSPLPGLAGVPIAIVFAASV